MTIFSLISAETKICFYVKMRLEVKMNALKNNHNKDRLSFSGRPIRSSSKRSSFEIKLSSKERSHKLNLNILSSSNSSRSKSKEK